MGVNLGHRGEYNTRNVLQEIKACTTQQQITDVLGDYPSDVYKTSLEKGSYVLGCVEKISDHNMTAAADYYGADTYKYINCDATSDLWYTGPGWYNIPRLNKKSGEREPSLYDIAKDGDVFVVYKDLETCDSRSILEGKLRVPDNTDTQE